MPFRASGSDRTDARFFSRPVEGLQDHESDISHNTHLKVVLRVKGCQIEKIGAMKLLLLYRSNIKRCYLSKETRRQYTVDLVAWPTTARARKAISKVRMAYRYFTDRISTINSTSRRRKTEVFYRTLTFNRTADGSDPLLDWGIMFSVIINGPSNFPSPFPWHGTSTDENERVMVYIEPFVNAIFRLAALPHILGISEFGSLYMYSGGRLWKEDLEGYGVFVILGCNTPLLLESYRVTASRNGDVETLLPCHTVVGVAYVHDYMYGRALEELDDGLFTTRILDIV